MSKENIFSVAQDDVEYNGKKYYVSTSWLLEYYETMVFEYNGNPDEKNGNNIDWSGICQLRTTDKETAIANHARVIDTIKAGTFEGEI